MTQAATVTEFICPGCTRTLATAEQGSTSCPECGWHGEVYRFVPMAVQINAAETALPDEATCIHHPSKKATAVCAGSGDYICSLCAIDVEGQTYSANSSTRADGNTSATLSHRLSPGPIAGSTSISSWRSSFHTSISS